MNMVSKNLLRSGLVLGMMLALTINAHSQQLSKDKKKALKKELKRMSPEEYWQLKNEQQEQKVAIITLEKENEALKEKLAEQAEDLAIKQDKNEHLEGENEAMTNTRSSATSPSSSPVPSGEWGKGVVFRVQIGALTEEEYEKEIPSGFSLDVEHKGDLKRMLVGYYRDYDEADSFKKLMRKLGIRTAWIVPYKDGKRVPLKEVLGEVVN